VKVRDLR